jgi:hypothetical protein
MKRSKRSSATVRFDLVMYVDKIERRGRFCMVTSGNHFLITVKHKECTNLMWPNGNEQLHHWGKPSARFLAASTYALASSGSNKRSATSPAAAASTACT